MSKLFEHPVTGEILGSTCPCGRYTVGGGVELCHVCRSTGNVEYLSKRVHELEALVKTLTTITKIEQDRVRDLELRVHELENKSL